MKYLVKFIVTYCIYLPLEMAYIVLSFLLMMLWHWELNPVVSKDKNEKDERLFDEVTGSLTYKLIKKLGYFKN